MKVIIYSCLEGKEKMQFSSHNFVYIYINRTISKLNFRINSKSIYPEFTLSSVDGTQNLNEECAKSHGVVSCSCVFCAAPFCGTHISTIET